MLFYEGTDNSFISAVDAGRFRQALEMLPDLVKGLVSLDVRARVKTQNNLAELYYELADYVSAKDAYTAATQEIAIFSVDDTRILGVLLLNQARLNRRLGLYDLALKNCEEALSREPEDESVRCMLHIYQGDIFRLFGCYGDAERSFSRVPHFIDYRKIPTGMFYEYYRRLGTLFRATGEYDQAEEAFLTAMHSQHEKPCHPEYGKLLSCVAELYRSKGWLREARPLYAQAYWILRRAYGTEHPDTAAHLGNLAELYRAVGDTARAEQLYVSSLTILRRTLGQNNPEYAKRLNNLAQLYRYSGELDKARGLLEEALGVLELVFGNEHHHVAKIYNNLSGVLLGMGHLDEAEALCRQSLEVRKKALGDEHHHLARSFMTLGNILEGKGNTAAAIDAFDQAVGVYHASLGLSHGETVLARRRADSLRNLQGA